MAVSEVAHLLAQLDADPDRLKNNEKRAKSAQDELRLLLRMKPGSVEYSRTLARLEDLARQAELELTLLDEKISATEFREVLSTVSIGPVLLLQYARLIARHFRADAHHTERLTSLVQRMLTLPKLDGSREIRPRSDTEAALAYVVRESRAPESVQRSAIDFLEKAMDRIYAIDKIEEVFGGGFYLDILGYQVSLREALLDAEILRASAELSAALWNQLVRLMRREGISLQQMYDRMSAVESEVARIFQTLEPEEPASIVNRFEERREQEEAQKKKAIKLLKPKHGMRVLAAALAAIVLGLGVGAVRKSFRNENELSPIPPAILGELSPVLASGETSSGEAQPILFARVLPSKWSLMSAEERTREASRLASMLEKKNLSAALVYDGSMMVMQIALGNVMYVQ